MKSGLHAPWATSWLTVAFPDKERVNGGTGVCSGFPMRRRNPSVLHTDAYGK
jgi:hypothetical protein